MNNDRDFLSLSVLNTSNQSAILKQSYDEAGLVAAASYYGIEEEPVKCKDGYHRIERTWMEKDHATSEAWFDENDEPMPLKDTYVRIERNFDEKKNTIAERYYGVDGKPIVRGKVPSFYFDYDDSDHYIATNIAL